MKHYVDHQLDKLTTFGIGGVARNVYVPNTRDEFLELLGTFSAASQPYRLLGKGSNILVSSRKINQPIVLTRYALSDLEVADDGLLHAGASVDIRRMINVAVRYGLRAPVELLTIPASVGGAVFMNAGRTSFETCISQSLLSVEVFDGVEVYELSAAECGFGHRCSLFQERRDLTILGACFRFPAADREEVSASRRASLDAAKDKCYWNQKSAGSIFKLCDWGLMKEMRGLRLGQAQYASQTPNCIINNGGANGREINALIALARLRHWLHGKECRLEVEIW